MDALKALEVRKSVRSYQQRPVEAGKLDTLLKAANNAPKAGEFHITVVLNPEMLSEINDKALAIMKSSGNEFLMQRAALPGYQPLYGAPVLLIFSAPDANHYSKANVSNAATCAIIAATAMDLGSCYVVTPTMPLNEDAALARKVGVPEGLKPMCGVLVGYQDGEKFATIRTMEDNINYY